MSLVLPVIVRLLEVRVRDDLLGLGDDLGVRGLPIAEILQVGQMPDEGPCQSDEVVHGLVRLVVVVVL